MVTTMRSAEVTISGPHSHSSSDWSLGAVLVQPQQRLLHPQGGVASVRAAAVPLVGRPDSHSAAGRIVVANSRWLWGGSQCAPIRPPCSRQPQEKSAAVIDHDGRRSGHSPRRRRQSWLSLQLITSLPRCQSQAAVQSADVILVPISGEATASAVQCSDCSDARWVVGGCVGARWSVVVGRCRPCQRGRCRCVHLRA